ncbi:MAG: nuclear transport factor 2 family protein, partial [Acidimicrobiia bacterium]
MPPTTGSPRPGRPDPAIVADRLAIADLMALYCRGIDRLDRDLVRSCFHPDATDTHGSFHGTIDEFLDWAFGLLGRY